MTRFFDCFLITFALGFSSTAPATLAVPFFRSPDAILPSGEASLEDLSRSKLGDGAAAAGSDVRLVEKDGRRLYLARANFWLAGDFSPGEGAVFVATPLRQKAEWKSDVLATLEAREHFRLLSAGEDFLDVTTKSGLRGFLPIETTILAADFASTFRVGKSIFSFHHRDRDRLVSIDGKSFDLADAEDFVPDQARGIMNVESTFPRRARLSVTKAVGPVEHFEVSNLPGYGRVFWKLPSEKLPESTVAAQRSDLEPGTQIYSRGGVFLASKDGRFHRIDHFGDQTLPVAVGRYQTNLIFAGSEISTDGGVNFQNFIEWPALFRAVSQVTHDSGSELRIAEIKQTSVNQVEYTVFTGRHILKLAVSPKIMPALKWTLVSWKSALDSSAL